MDETDAELLAASARNPEAFGIFYDRHAESLLTYFARRTWDAQEAADLTAETFAAAFAARRRYRDTGAPAFAWLLGIARHQLHRALRRQRIDARARRRLHVERVVLDDASLARTSALPEQRPRIWPGANRSQPAGAQAYRDNVIKSRGGSTIHVANVAHPPEGREPAMVRLPEQCLSRPYSDLAQGPARRDAPTHTQRATPSLR
jgi:DNA-directed RNA polymerase specialized sigma24 family protein